MGEGGTARTRLHFRGEQPVGSKKSIDVTFHKRDVVYTNITAAIPKPVPFQVQIPRPLMHLTSKHYLVMHFCEGGRVDDFDLMEQQGIARDAVMDAVSQTFAHMMCSSVSDIFNGNPHPGNVFLRAGTTVGKEGFTLVLLDWGLAKADANGEALSILSNGIGCCDILHFGLLLDAFEAVGLKNEAGERGRRYGRELGFC
jgi:hypothetical protein